MVSDGQVRDGETESRWRGEKVSFHMVPQIPFVFTVLVFQSTEAKNNEIMTMLADFKAQTYFDAV